MAIVTISLLFGTMALPPLLLGIRKEKRGEATYQGYYLISLASTTLGLLLVVSVLQRGY